jgi:hypothetical protein
MAKRCESKFIAKVISRSWRGEEFHRAVVVMDGHVAVFHVQEHMNKQTVCLEILDWAGRMGKRIDWEYRT